jgi:hypothetical protein
VLFLAHHPMINNSRNVEKPAGINKILSMRVSGQNAAK